MSKLRMKNFDNDAANKHLNNKRGTDLVKCHVFLKIRILFIRPSLSVINNVINCERFLKWTCNTSQRTQ